MSRPAKVTVAAPLESDTFNGAFLSPTKNIACNIDITSGSQEVRGSSPIASTKPTNQPTNQPTKKRC
jgi:hypothetical protein